MTEQQQVPMICGLVSYRLSAHDVSTIQGQPNAAYNPVSEGDEFPALIVRVFGDSPFSAVNLRVFIDGDVILWCTSRMRGVHPGQWDWPERAS